MHDDLIGMRRILYMALNYLCVCRNYLYLHSIIKE